PSPPPLRPPQTFFRCSGYPDHGPLPSVPARRSSDLFRLVDVAELLRLGGGGAGHARQLGVEAEVVLDGDRGQRLVLGLDLGAFLDRKSTRLNSSHVKSSYAVCCLKENIP